MNNSEKKLLIANWKMNGSRKLVEDYRQHIVCSFPKVELVICPPLPFLPLFNHDHAINGLSLGAQDVSHIGGHGAYTGEVSIDLLKEFGVKYVIIGHCEARKLHGSQNIAQKIRNCLAADIKPILCIGENLEEKKSGKMLEILENQIQSAGIEGQKQEIIIAYEPIWAIEMRKALNAEELEEILLNITSILDRNNINNSKILYGGAVNGENVKTISACSKIKGLLVGSASLNYDRFLEIINNI